MATNHQPIPEGWTVEVQQRPCLITEAKGGILTQVIKDRWYYMYYKSDSVDKVPCWFGFGHYAMRDESIDAAVESIKSERHVKKAEPKWEVVNG